LAHGARRKTLWRLDLPVLGGQSDQIPLSCTTVGGQSDQISPFLYKFFVLGSAAASDDEQPDLVPLGLRHNLPQLVHGLDLQRVILLRSANFTPNVFFILFFAGLWIRVRIRVGSGFNNLVDPDPYWESGSKGKKIKKFQWKNALFSYFLKNFTTKKV
jgi:hypothetical protein